jgi:predicted peptidase
MNVFRRFVVVHTRALELLLLLAIILLVGQVTWPTIIHWWRLPGTGATGFDAFQAATLEPEFAIQLPRSYYKEQYWPLVVFLHGSGERGKDPELLRSQGPFRQDLPAIVAAPQCLPSYNWDSNAVAGLIQHIVSRYSVDRTRIYLLGYSMGGYGTWQTAASHPELFAAIVPISGGGDPDEAKTLTAVPVWAFHGESDKVVPVAESERMVDAIRKAGGEPKLTVIPEAGHGICDSVCSRPDIWEWLFQQRRDR